MIIKTGIPGLDKMFQGGIYRGSSTLIEGAPGTGKTTLGMQFIYSGITQFNEKGLYVTFEYFPQFLYRDAKNFGWDFKKLEEEKKLVVYFTSPEVLISGLKDPQSDISKIILDLDIKRVVIDTITQFHKMTKDPYELREIINTLVNALRREDLTSFLLCETSVIQGASLTEDPCGLSFVADNIIILHFVEIESKINKSIVVLKARGMNHSKDIRHLEITQKGIIIEDKFEGQEGILSGAPRSTYPVEKLREFFGK